jgi:hypothetical protein
MEPMPADPGGSADQAYGRSDAARMRADRSDVIALRRALPVVGAMYVCENECVSLKKRSRSAGPSATAAYSACSSGSVSGAAPR